MLENMTFFPTKREKNRLIINIDSGGRGELAWCPNSFVWDCSLQFDSGGKQVGSNILTRIQLSIKINLKCLFVSDKSIDCSLRRVFISLGSQRLHDNLDYVLVISIK